MVNEFKIKSKKIIEANSKELHNLRLTRSQDNSGNEIAALRKFIKNEKQFKIFELVVTEDNYINISIRWLGQNYGKYFIH